MARLTNLTQCDLVEYGYAQVEPNHLSAQRTGQIYAQLPAAASITVLENGQFAKYDYAKGVVDFDGEGEWMLVYNEVKVYRDLQRDCDFAMVKGNYEARVYSPITGKMSNVNPVNWTSAVAAADPYEIDSTATPMGTQLFEGPAMMKENTTMVPRLLKTNIGDIFTTNAINFGELAEEDRVKDLTGKTLAPVDGILTIGATDASGMLWQIVKDYTMPDGQRGVKIMRIA